LFCSDRFAGVSLARRLALTPDGLVRVHLGARLADRVSAHRGSVVR
jgi:hypothetical protein